jgi:hypothetical protein
MNQPGKPFIYNFKSQPAQGQLQTQSHRKQPLAQPTGSEATQAKKQNQSEEPLQASDFSIPTRSESTLSAAKDFPCD